MFIKDNSPENLKSNMDRFIVPKTNETEKYNKDLKSNMDRFIVRLLR